MNEILHDCLFPVMLGASTQCHALVRMMEKRYGVGSVVLTGKRALTLRFLPSVTLISAPPTFADDTLLAILSDVNDMAGGRLPLLVLCADEYRGFITRNSAALESDFILREAKELLGQREEEVW